MATKHPSLGAFNELENSDFNESLDHSKENKMNGEEKEMPMKQGGGANREAAPLTSNQNEVLRQLSLKMIDHNFSNDSLVSSSFNADDTQPLDFSNEEPMATHQQPRQAFARLEPLRHDVDPIDLFNLTFVCGRGLDLDYEFTHLRGDIKLYQILSRKQFQLTHDPKSKKTTLFDLSLNGTLVNHVMVGKGNSVDLACGDVISIGFARHVVFAFQTMAQTNYPKELTDKFIMTNVYLGKGGYGKVLLATIKADVRKKVAVKILSRSAFTSSRRFSRNIAKKEDIENEASIMKNITHPNCLKFFELVQSDCRAFIVMELVSGGELFDRIVDPKHNSNGLGEDLTKFYAWQLLNALTYLHAKNITHRDIKPENILCVGQFDYTIVKLTDFGLAKETNGPNRKVMKTHCGTPTYIAPEMIENDRTPYTDKVDIWSLGVVLFTAIVGYPPFSSDYHDMELDEQIKKGRLIWHSQWKYVSAESQRYIVKMLTVNHVSRPSAASLFQSDWMDCNMAKAAARCVQEYFGQVSLSTSGDVEMASCS